MTNNDTTYGTFNKKTHIYRQTDKNGNSITSPKVFQNIDEAIKYFFHPELLDIFNECCTNLEWALVNDHLGRSTKLKVTFDFGVKGNVAPEEEWAVLFNTRKAKVRGQPNDSGGYWRQENFTNADSEEHLF